MQSTCSKCRSDLQHSRFFSSQLCTCNAGSTQATTPSPLSIHTSEHRVATAPESVQRTSHGGLGFRIFFQHGTACTDYEHHCKHIGSMFHAVVLSFQTINLESFWHHLGFIFDVFWRNFGTILVSFWGNFWSEKRLGRLSKSSTEKWPKMRPESARKLIHVGTYFKQNGHQFGC